MAANRYPPRPEGNAFSDLRRAFNNHADLIDGLVAGGTAEGDRYVYHEVNAGNTPFQVPDGYANVVGARSGTGPTLIQLPVNADGQSMFCVIADLDGNAPQNPISTEWNSFPGFTINKSGGSVILAFDTVNGGWVPLSYDAFFVTASRFDFFTYIDLGSTGSTLLSTLTSPFGAGFSFIPIDLEVRKATGTNWTTAPIISIGTNAPNYNNLMAAQNLGTLAGAGRWQFVATKPSPDDGDNVYINVLQAGAVAGSPMGAVLMSGYWVPLPTN